MNNAHRPATSLKARWPILLVAPAMLLNALFIGVPLVGLSRTSVSAITTPLDTHGVSSAHFARFLTDSFYLQILAETIGYGLTVAVISLILGFPIGYLLGRARARPYCFGQLFWRRYERDLGREW